MANWSKEMWQGVVNRAVRMLASGPFALHFSAAFANRQLKRELGRERFGIECAFCIIFDYYYLLIAVSIGT
ncbi:hypothetical protein KIN20_034532 [Parelaphostrongylus tenuis]|uniref:Uncharacterized protein n=1 Tax=Parelaphostrongylus tenuis TaxID=148309 RepID=A0AAD5RAH3_PARTN|nr:hypothetical protein KIN20_034532 [Parelaphostrongylus tenuis]